jgi:branched-chain amino acid transport system substrate-binding protein
MGKQVLKVIICALLFTSNSYADGEVKIGWIGPLTGNSAVLGIDSIKAVEIAAAERNLAGGINGKKIRIIFEDDQYDTTKALSAYNKLVSQGVVAILMSTYGGVFAVNDRVTKDDVIVINPLDCNNDIAALSQNIFCIATESESIGRVIAEHIHDNQYYPVGVIYDERNPFMVLVANVIKEDFSKNEKIELISSGIDQNAVTDFRSLLLKFRVNQTKALILLGHDPMGQAMREARNIGLKSKFYTVGTITSPGYQQLAGPAAEGTYVAFWEAAKSARLDKFLAAFNKEAGRPPILQLATIPSYDSAHILFTALEGAVTSANKIEVARVKDNLLSLRDYHGLSGTLTMDPDGAVRSIKETIYQFVDSELVAQ